MIVSSTGHNIRVKKWEIENPKAQIFFVHGYAEHISRYKHLAKKFNKEGFSVIGYDHVGHGKSEGERAYVNRFDMFVWDLKRVIDEYRQEELPTFIFGHSMGGLIVTSFCTLYQPNDFAGVITSGAALQVNESPFLQKIAPFFSEIIPHTKTKPIGSQDISRDADIVEEYDNDPMVYRGGIKMRMAAEMILRIKKTNKIANLFTSPALFMHGGADQLTDPNGTKVFYENCGSTDKELKIWDGLFHELINEPEKDQVFDIMLQWSNARLPVEIYE